MHDDYQNIDDLFRKRLHDHESDIPPLAWSAIQKGIEKENKQGFLYRYRYWGFGALALCLIGTGAWWWKHHIASTNEENQHIAHHTSPRGKENPRHDDKVTLSSISETTSKSSQKEQTQRFYPNKNQNSTIEPKEKELRSRELKSFSKANLSAFTQSKPFSKYQSIEKKNTSSSNSSSLSSNNGILDTKEERNDVRRQEIEKSNVEDKTSIALPSSPKEESITSIEKCFIVDIEPVLWGFDSLQMESLAANKTTQTKNKRKQKSGFVLGLVYASQKMYAHHSINQGDSIYIVSLETQKAMNSKRLDTKVGLRLEKRLGYACEMYGEWSISQVRYQHSLEYATGRTYSHTPQVDSVSGTVILKPNYPKKKETFSLQNWYFNTSLGIRYMIRNGEKSSVFVFSGANATFLLNEKHKQNSITSNYGFTVGMGYHTLLTQKVRLSIEPHYHYYFNDLVGKNQRILLKPYTLGVNFAVSIRF